VGIRHQSFLEFKQYRYLKLAFGLVLLALVAYVWHRNTQFFNPGGVGYGGTWMGYTLGSLATALIVWLLFLGVRKRRYRASSTSLQGWVSAHVYLGVATLFIALLHSGFELGFNLHSFTLTLLIGVVISGIYGVLMYVRVPLYMTEKMGEDSLESLLRQIQTLDTQARKVSLSLSDQVNGLLLRAATGTRLSGSFFDEFVGQRISPCPTDEAVREMQVLIRTLKPEHSVLGREVLTLMVSRQAAVRLVRQELRSMARLKRWLLWHVPLSIALLFALAAHIVSVFIYW
jgi:hypothetical protein